MYYIIANPVSQSGKNHVRITEKLTGILAQRGIAYQIRYTENARDPERIAAQIPCRPCSEEEQPVVVVIGGDGTINGVLNGIRNLSGVKFSFIPAGSANDLAKGLQLKDTNGDPEQTANLRSIADGKIRRTIDLGRIRYDRKERLFAISAGIGFDAAVCHESDESRTRTFFNTLRLGKLTYGTIALKQLFSAPAAICHITSEEGAELHIRKLLFATFMNTPYEGGGYKFAPDAVCDDGLINLSAIGDLSKFTALIHFPSAYRGAYYHVKGVFHFMTREMNIRTDCPLWVHTDGEVVGQFTDLSVSCVPRSLRMIM